MKYWEYCWANRYTQLFVLFLVFELWNLLGDDPYLSDYADPLPHIIPVLAMVVLVFGSYWSWKKKFGKP
jgi:hypothetical protein